MAGTVTVSITGDAESLKRALGDAQSSLSSFADKAQSVGERATSIGRSMTLGITLPLIGLGKMAFDELSRAAAASAQTEAAIRSTGGAANVTAKQVDELSTSLLNKSGIDDEVIKSGANVLLTFTGIRNEVGKGNDIFNQATKATLDLSVAFGKDMSSSAILVGKALQDPIAGVSALRRVGVQLSDSQVELIKNLVATGDTMGAQKVILGELTREVGGSAEAYGNSFAGKVAKAKEELSNASAAILVTAVPVMQKVAEFALGAAHAFESLPAPVKEAGVVFGALLAAVGPLSYAFGAVMKLAGGVSTVIGGLAPAFVAARGAVVNFVASLSEIGFAGLVAAAAPVVAAFAGIALAVAAIGIPMHMIFGGDDGFISSLKKGQTEGKKFADVLIAGAQSSGAPLAALRTSISELRSEQDSLTAAHRAGTVGFEEGVTAYAKNQTAIKGLKGEIANLKQQEAEASAQHAATVSDLQGLADGTTKWADATDSAKKALEDINNVMAGTENASLALETANAKLTEATNAYNAALASGDPNAIAEAERNLQGARYDVANATDRAASAQNDYLGLINQGPAAIEAEIAKIRDEIATYGDSSGVLQERINKLGAMRNAILGLPESWPVDVPVNADPSSVYTLRQELINITGQPWNVIVNVTSEFDNLYGMPSDRNIKRDIVPVPA